MENELATQSEPAVPQDDVSMDDTIRATLESIKARESEGEVTEPAAPVKADRQRAPDGKFAKVEPDTTEAPPSAPVAALPVEGDEAAPPVQTEAVQPPSSWKAEAKAAWTTLPPQIQKEVLRREEDFHRGVSQYKDAAQFAQTMQRTLSPYMNTIQQLGVSPDVAVNALLQADQSLRFGSSEQKAAAFAQLAHSYGIDLSQGLPQIDPNAYRLQQELQQRDQKIQELTASQQQREQDELNSLIEQSRQGKEHFDAVRTEMSALLQAGSAKTLDEAYEMAVWAKPELRQSLLTKQQEERRAKEAEIARNAKAAAATNVPRRGTLPASKPVGTMDETIRDTLATIRSRA
jgi:hypothetical protein